MGPKRALVNKRVETLASFSVLTRSQPDPDFRMAEELDFFLFSSGDTDPAPPTSHSLTVSQSE